MGVGWRLGSGAVAAGGKSRTKVVSDQRMKRRDAESTGEKLNHSYRKCSTAQELVLLADGGLLAHTTYRLLISSADIYSYNL